MPRRGDLPLFMASQSVRARVSAMLNYKGRLPQNCIERQQYPQGPVMQFFAMTIYINHVIPRRGNREAVGSTLLLCPDVEIYRCLWASQSERARVSARLREQWSIATELHRASAVSARPRDAILRNDDINSFCHPEQSEGSRG